MKESVIISLAYGHQRTHEDFEETQELKKLLKAEAAADKKLQEVLDDEQKELLDDFQDAMMFRYCEEKDISYAEGFRLGMLLAFEAINGYFNE